MLHTGNLTVNLALTLKSGVVDELAGDDWGRGRTYGMTAPGTLLAAISTAYSHLSQTSKQGTPFNTIPKYESYQGGRSPAVGCRLPAVSDSIVGVCWGTAKDCHVDAGFNASTSPLRRAQDRDTTRVIVDECRRHASTRT